MHKKTIVFLLLILFTFSAACSSTENQPMNLLRSTLRMNLLRSTLKTISISSAMRSDFRQEPSSNKTVLKSIWNHSSRQSSIKLMEMKLK